MINPTGILIESNYDNNGVWFLIEINQEASPPRATILWAEQSMCPAP
jgi:hypothetical protein